MRQGRLRLVEGKIVWLYVAAALCRPSNILLIRILLHLRILTIPICIPHPFYNCTYYCTYTHKLSVGLSAAHTCMQTGRERERESGRAACCSCTSCESESVAGFAARLLLMSPLCVCAGAWCRCCMGRGRLPVAAGGASPLACFCC